MNSQIPNLSILICSVSVRHKYLNRLLHKLQDQLIENPDLQKKIEIIVFADNFELKTGKKRNMLIDKSKGKFVVFIDDDDLVSDNYCKLISDIIDSHSNIDYIGFKLECIINGEPAKPVYHSSRYDGWYDDESGYYRHWSHINPTKREIMVKYPFLDVLCSEDSNVAGRIYRDKVIKREFFIDDIMYIYDARGEVSLTTRQLRKNNIKNQEKYIDWVETAIDKIDVHYL